MADLVYPNSQSTLTWGGYTFQHLAVGGAIVIEPVNPLTARTNSTGGGTSVTKRADAGVHNVAIMVQRHSPDDKFMNDRRNDAVPFVADGSAKRAYIEAGTSKKATVTLSSGSITTQPSTTENNQDPDDTRTYVIEVRNAVETF